ncbi:MAG: RNA-binding S4 domain-containing protein [Bacteroidota bacterium]
MRDVFIHTQPIQLYKLLKLESLVSSGGEAKMVISEGLVEVNGEIETRKRKQIVAGDVIVFGEESIKVNLDQPDNQS